MNDKILQNKKFLFGLLIFLIALFVIILYFLFSTPQSEVLIIDNLNSSIEGLPDNHKDRVQKTLYNFIIKQNNINNIENKNIYHGVIRENSTKTTGEYSTEFILDIPELQYSYLAQFYWTKIPTTEDLGPVSIYCLPKTESIYPDFNCEQNPTISIKTDPLLSIGMVVNDNCWMSPFSSVESKSGYGVDILYHPTDDDYQNDTIESSYNACVKSAKEYLTSNGLNLNDYKIRSEIKYFYNY